MNIKELQEYNQKKDTARLSYVNQEYGCCDQCGDSATNNDRAYLEGYDDGYDDGYNQGKLEIETNTENTKTT